jgi:hypothetical protein
MASHDRRRSQVLHAIEKQAACAGGAALSQQNYFQTEAAQAHAAHLFNHGAMRHHPRR